MRDFSGEYRVMDLIFNARRQLTFESSSIDRHRNRRAWACAGSSYGADGALMQVQLPA
jgi:hypothetical protein